MSTPFDEESADMLDNLGMAIFKIPSGEITNKLLIQHIAGKKKPFLVVTVWRGNILKLERIHLSEEG